MGKIDSLIEELNGILDEIREARKTLIEAKTSSEKTTRDLRKWRPPVHRPERRATYEKNPQCFLKVEKGKRGELIPKYPVCPKGSTEPTCEGAIAAIRRANINHDSVVAQFQSLIGRLRTIQSILRV